uniref:Uncharacterized protein n=1 Tax=Anguilla anguilla TaxID=7936 RepID=A0A0E9XRY2_ANGAN
MCSALRYPPSSVSVLIWSGCRWVTYPSSVLSRFSVLRSPVWVEPRSVSVLISDVCVLYIT